MEHMLFVRVPNMVSALKGCKKRGCWVAGAVASAKLSIAASDLTGPLVLVIGGEEKGIRPLVQETCDFLVSIPQMDGVDSLNAAVAGAIVMYEAARQRRGRREGERARK
jgi:23S rRNA (guanosine2251-2'-O)-methyltransferase